MIRRQSIQLLTLCVSVGLGACVHVKIDEDRQVASDLASGETVVLVASPQSTGVAAEREFLACLEKRLEDSAATGNASGKGAESFRSTPAINLVPQEAFVDSLYPWLEASTVPAQGEDFVRTLLARPGVQQRIKDSKVRYLIAVNGQTNVTDKDGSFTCSVGAGVAGCLGLAFWKKESGYEATIWDMKAGNAVGTVGANVDGRSVFIGAVVPLPFVAPVQRTACAKLAGELRDFILGKDVTTRGSEG